MEEIMKYKVSVITVVFNAERYLEKMIRSIIRQTIGFNTIQLILVDDGSEDSSGNICDKYALKYPNNVVVVHKGNDGASSARNEALEYVEGKYVNFTDANDILENDALEKMYEYLKNNEKRIDLVTIPLIYSEEKHRKRLLNYKYAETRLVNLEEEYDSIQLSINNTLIKKECFNSRCFDEQLIYAGSIMLLIDILLDKMWYGIVCGTSCLHRKYDIGDLAHDLGRKNPRYYISYMERFILQLLNGAMKKKDMYLDLYNMHVCMIYSGI